MTDRQFYYKQGIAVGLKRRFGFTLAEVLITLAVIGVVASMAIPALMNVTNKIEYVSALKKETAVLNQVYSTLAGENGGDIRGVYAGTTGVQVGNAWMSKLSVSKVCGMTSTGCFPDIFPYLLGHQTLGGLNYNTDNNYFKAILNDGASIAIRYYGAGNDCKWDRTWPTDTTSPLYETCSEIFIDINGFKPPNEYGRDLFAFTIGKTQLIPFGSYPDVWTSNCTTNGLGCASKVLKEGAMNY